MKRVVWLSTVILATAFVGLGAVVLLRHSAPSPAISNTTFSTPILRTGSYVIQNDGPVAAYDCPRIDCTMVVEIPNGAIVNLVGVVQGDALYPVSWQGKTVYVMETWLTSTTIKQTVQYAVRDYVAPSAVCGDGRVSHSRNRRGTCSHHRGVKTWLK
jgi:hypothetical protein